jgi:hypothetical protein
MNLTYDALDVGQDLLLGQSPRQVIDADHEEDLGRLRLYHLAQSVQHPLGHVTAYAPVLARSSCRHR